MMRWAAAFALVALFAIVGRCDYQVAKAQSADFEAVCQTRKIIDETC